MAVTNLPDIKNKFKNGDLPNENDFEDAFDTTANPQIGFEQDSSISLSDKLVQFIMDETGGNRQLIFNFAQNLFNATFDSDDTNPALGNKTQVGISTALALLQYVDKVTSNSVLLTAGADGVQVRDDIRNRGITGVADFSQNLQELDYAQKSYIDSAPLSEPAFGAVLNIDLNNDSISSYSANAAYTLGFTNIPQDLAPKKAKFGSLKVEVSALHTLTLGANVINIGGIDPADITQTINDHYFIFFQAVQGNVYISILNEQ